jgi:hypothetical protein
VGWGSGNEIFDPVCEEIIRQVEKADGLYPDDATKLLTVLVYEMQQGDWDTEDESLSRFQDYDYVVKAFEANGITLSGED